ncbi:LacI family DNA-binding transcriptional regulator, partial [Tabrizicola sp.]|uniref:LacI family DNA-binding transcriptional regulator n=1 Tax=Tabrizicola sp. TaxID=2005166 RepID=UPI003F2E49A3
MLRARISDIARSAGVSTATVDRVLNGRPGVSAANRQRVMQAAEMLHYLPSDHQTVLPARPAQLEFFLPRGSQAFLGDVAQRLEEFAGSLPLVSRATVHALPDLSAEALIASVERIDLGTHGVGVVAVDHPRTRLVINDLIAAGVKVVTFASDLLATGRSAYVGLDDRVAGRTAGLVMGRFCGDRAGKVALFVGQRGFLGQRERELGFLNLIEQEFPNLAALPTVDLVSNNELAETTTRALLAEHPDLVGIYCMGGGRSGIARALSGLPRDRRPFVIMHDLSDVT